MKIFEIKTERLTVRLAGDGEMRRLIFSEKDEGLRLAYGEMLSFSEKFPEERQWYAAWFIELPGGERVGDLCFKGIGPGGAVEIGYGLLEGYCGRGYATEAVSAAVRWAADQPGVSRIEAETEEENEASKKVLARCGFVPTGETGEEGPRFVYNHK